MTSLTRLAYFAPFESQQEYQCLICFEKVDAGVAHGAFPTNQQEQILHTLHQRCLQLWIKQCAEVSRHPECPACKALITERSLQQVFLHFSEVHLVDRSIYWQKLFHELMITAKDFEEQKKPWKLQAEKVIDEFRFILDGIHRFYIQRGSEGLWFQEPMLILEGIGSMFAAIELAIKVKQKELPLLQEMSFLESLNPSMQRHVLKVVEFLKTCVITKKQMLVEDAEDISSTKRSLQAVSLVTGAVGLLAGYEAAEYFNSFETPASTLIFKITGALSLAATLYKVTFFTHNHFKSLSQEHLTGAFRKLALDQIPFQS